MDAPYSLYIFTLLLLTVNHSMELASSSMRCYRSQIILQARQGEVRGSTQKGSVGPVNCTWIITSSESERVILSFSQFSVGCGRNWVSVATLRDKPMSLCGYKLPKPMELYGGNITVTFHFNPHFYSAFKLSYIKDSGPCHPGEFECYSDRCLPGSWRCNGQVECLGRGDDLGSDEEDCDIKNYQNYLDNRPSPLPSAGPISTDLNVDVVTERPRHQEPDVRTPQGGSCGGYLKAFYGSFVPPLATKTSMECVWTVDPQDSRALKLELQLLKLGTGDTLIITDRPAGAGNIIKIITYTSNSKTVEVESPTGLLSVTYRTQNASEVLGFNATYRVADYCLPWEGHCKVSEGGCFTPSQRCNGHWDCVESGLDEEGCGGCPAGSFPCGMTKSGHLGVRPVCYTISERCNYQLTCTDGSDERECTICQPGTFHCDTDRCVFESWRCDGQVDCKDGTDELNCTMILPRKVITAATVGSLVCGLLLVIAMGCTCKLYSLRTREYSLFAPISRQEAEFIQQQAPPSYGQLIAQGIIPPVEDFPTENPNEPTSLSLRGLLQLIRQDNISSPRRRRRPRFVRRALRRLRRWGIISRPASRSAQNTSSSSQQTEGDPSGQESGQSGTGGSSVSREASAHPLPQKVALSQSTVQEQSEAAPPPPPISSTSPQSPPVVQSVDPPETPPTPPVAVPPSSPSLASIFHSLGINISRFRPSASSTTLPLSSSPSFSSSSSEDEVLLIPLSDDTTSEDDVPMLT